MNSKLFTLNSIVRTYGKTAETLVHAVDSVSFEIGEGEFTAIVGPSGSGKTTLLNIMSGLDNPCHGDVTLDGMNISLLSGRELSDFRRDHIGIIFQSYNLIPVLTVKENVEYVMTLQGIDSKQKAERVAEILSEVGLEGKENRFPKELSGGQQQRVAIARALVAKPKIIIADEPTANLDSKTAHDLLDIMENLNRKFNTTFIFSTHDQKIMDRARRLITLRDGKVESDVEK